MPVKVALLVLFCLMVIGAVHFAQPRASEERRAPTDTSHSVRLLTWNIGYAELEDDTRAHDKDLPAIAELILKEDPDAVALQELTGTQQLNTLVGLLKGKYRGAVAQWSKLDRLEAVLAKDPSAQFVQIVVGDRNTVGTQFKAHDGMPKLLLISVHADAFNAAKRRAYTEALINFTERHQERWPFPVFIAGDFNFELKAAKQTNLYTDNLKHDSESYSNILSHFKDLGRSAGDTAINDRRIDYIFGPPQATPGRVEVLRTAAVGRMDHWPLLIEVEP